MAANPRERAADEAIQNTIDSIADIHAEHYTSLPTSQIGIEWVTSRLGKPWSVFFVLGAMALWVGYNLSTIAHGHRAVDPPPFFWLQGCTTGLAVVMTFFILTTANRQNALDERRAQLTLQIALLSETKIAKIIELVERIRSEHPLLSNPTHEETGAMTTPADPKSVLDTMDAAHRDALNPDDAS
ncbi:MAG: DUF1003 domain-containing protein [Candidatus Eremiobacteraeota bacterium]|nr:DUF1003 domain-containing protein [Candidatus Eremiobacteraeota bacterium]